MPEATKCSYIELADASIRIVDEDESYVDWLAGNCPEPVEHRLVTQVEGMPEPTVDHLCCFHRTQFVDEIMRGEVPGVTIVADTVLQAKITARVRPAPAPQVGWCYVVKVVSAHGGGHLFPPVMLQAQTYEEAKAEAAAKVVELQALAASDQDWGKGL